MGFRACAPLVTCLLVITAACDGGENSAGTQAVSSTPATTTVPPGKAVCVTGVGGFEEFLGPRLVAQKGQLAEHMCGTAMANGWYDQNDSSWAEVAPGLRENSLYLMNPFCTGVGEDFFHGLPEEVQEDIRVEINSAQWGLKFCRAWFDDQYFTPEGRVEESGAARFIGDHLSLFEPVLIAQMRSALGPVFPVSGVSREEFDRAAKQTVHKAIKTGAISASPHVPFMKWDQDAVKALLVEALAQYL
jgi:hypothetical protein